MAKLNLNIDPNNVQKEFERIANELMNDWILTMQDQQYRITEIEFYYNSEIHTDQYVHGHELQKQKGKWYFHPSGIDLTFGNDEVYGGILLRAIYNLNEKTKDRYIYGPLKLQTELFSHIKSAYKNNFLFGLAPDTQNKIHKEKPIAAPRVGLNPKNDEEMYNKLYRFLVLPKMKHAEKTKIANAMKKMGVEESKIKTIWG